MAQSHSNHFQFTTKVNLSQNVETLTRPVSKTKQPIAKTKQAFHVADPKPCQTKPGRLSNVLFHWTEFQLFPRSCCLQHLHADKKAVGIFFPRSALAITPIKMY